MKMKYSHDTISGSNRHEDAQNVKPNPKTNPTKEDKTNASDTSNDEVFNHENDISTEKTESNQSVSKKDLSIQKKQVHEKHENAINQ